MVRVRSCDACNDEYRLKNFARIRGKYYCKSGNNCQRKIRLAHRESTIEKAGIRGELDALQRKMSNESQLSAYHRNKKLKRKVVNIIPKIKGSVKKKSKQSSNSIFITYHERQDMLRMLMGRGLSFFDAKSRLDDLVKSQQDLAVKLRNEKKSDEEIKIKQKELLIELWNY